MNEPTSWKAGLRVLIILITGAMVPACGGGGGSGGGGPAPNSAPVLTLTSPSGTQYKVIVLDYQIADAESDLASVAVEFSANGGTTWAPATRNAVGQQVTDLSTSPAGTAHWFYWDSVADGVALTGPNPNVLLRMTPTAGSTGGVVSTTAFTVQNDSNLFIGVATNTYPRNGTAEQLQEAAIGDLVTDAMRTRYSTQLAIMSGGSLRSPLPSPFAPANTGLKRPQAGYAAGPPFDLVLEDVYAVAPFSNRVVTRTITGAELWAVLEHSVSVQPASFGGFLQISGFSFTYKLSAPSGSRVLNVLGPGAVPIPADATTYTIALPDFNNDGGDGYTTPLNPAFPLPGPGTRQRVLADVVLEHIIAAATITPALTGRITQVP